MNLRKVLLPVLMLTLFNQANAQQRTCDMNVTLLEPATSAVINAFAQYNVRVNVANNGPDTLFSGDTLYYNLPSMPLITYNPYILTQNIVPHANLNLTLATLNNVNSDQTDQVMDYYVFVVSNPFNTGSFIDTTNDDNNYDINQNVTFKAGNPTGITDVRGNNALIGLYPNPASSALNIKVGAGNSVSSITINDISGREVLNMAQLKSNGDKNIDISALQPGMYIVQVETEKGRATGKFIKQ
jgi:hypothetical protein